MDEIILDKSYLDAATAEQVHALCGEHQVLMPEVLFYELTTTKNESMRNCFRKFPDVDDPVALVPYVETLLLYERSARRPSVPLYERRKQVVFRFNRHLGAGTFEFTGNQRKARQYQEAIVKQETEDFFQLAMSAATFFPEINGIPYVDLPQKILAAKTRIATETALVRGIYQQIVEAGNSSDQIPPDALDVDWAHFRWVQVRCLYSLDLIHRYNGQLPSGSGQTFWTSIEHDMLDSEYLVLASLSGAFACNENRLIEFFRLIRPDGRVYPCR